jgi:hemerythrin-like domain-containing protein
VSVPPHREPGGLELYDDLTAVHAVLRRGAELVISALERLSGGDSIDIATPVRLARWHVEFLRHHDATEDALLLPLLRRVYPDDVATLDGLLVEHETLSHQADDLNAAIDAMAVATSLPGSDALAAAVGLAALEGLPAAVKLYAVLLSHLDSEEAVLRRLFGQVPEADAQRLHEAIVASWPRTAPGTVFNPAK